MFKIHAEDFTVQFQSRKNKNSAEKHSDIISMLTIQSHGESIITLTTPTLSLTLPAIQGLFILLKMGGSWGNSKARIHLFLSDDINKLVHF